MTSGGLELATIRNTITRRSHSRPCRPAKSSSKFLFQIDSHRLAERQETLQHSRRGVGQLAAMIQPQTPFRRHGNYSRHLGNAAENSPERSPEHVASSMFAKVLIPSQSRSHPGPGSKFWVVAPTVHDLLFLRRPKPLHRTADSGRTPAQGPRS